MKNAAILLNGVKVPYHIIDDVFSRAKNNEFAVRVFFLFQLGEKMEDYTFPSDIEEAETLVGESEGDYQLQQLIFRNIKFVEKEAARHEIEVQVDYFNKPALELIAEKCRDCQYIFVDGGNFRHPKQIANADITFDELRSAFEARLVEMPVL